MMEQRILFPKEIILTVFPDLPQKPAEFQSGAQDLTHTSWPIPLPLCSPGHWRIKRCAEQHRIPSGAAEKQMNHRASEQSIAIDDDPVEAMISRRQHYSE
ncbi:MAG: hypothetical protein JXR73_00955 [Candidatus Omnitrophica bacterium]|nr:hypothetical protein [Candidatus Omnitrophota bacterium]